MCQEQPKESGVEWLYQLGVMGKGECLFVRGAEDLNLGLEFFLSLLEDATRPYGLYLLDGQRGFIIKNEVRNSCSLGRAQMHCREHHYKWLL